jgi:hypothetical protein
MNFDLLFGIDKNASDKKRSDERARGLYQLALVVGDKLARGQISKELAEDARAALAAHVLNEGANRPEIYREWRNTGALEAWREVAAGRDLNESSQASEQRHADALRVVLKQVAADAYERGAINDGELVEYTADIDPAFLEQVRHDVGLTKTIPGDLDGHLAPLETPEELHAAIYGEDVAPEKEAAAPTEPTVGDAASEADLERYFAAREAQDSPPQSAETVTATATE